MAELEVHIPASAPSFYAKHGTGGFSMTELVAAAKKVAGLERGQVDYAPGYSEENVYHLIDTLLDFEQAKSIDELSVVFVGNRTRKVQLWSLKDIQGGLEVLNDGLTTREFHSFLVQSPPPADDSNEPSASYVWDLDAKLPFPCRLGIYASHVLRVQAGVQLGDRQVKHYRVVKATQFKKHFASDRAHAKMSDGTWAVPPPPWEPIINAGGTTSTIAKFFTFSGTVPTHIKPEELEGDYGAVMDELTLMELFNVHLTS